MVNAVNFITLFAAATLAKEHTTKNKTKKTKTTSTLDSSVFSSVSSFESSSVSSLEPSTISTAIEISSSDITSAPATTTTSPVNSEVPAFGQCGGQSNTGLTNCGLGYQCVYQNEFYSQCIAIDYSREQYAQRWEQCHGINYNGPTDCVPGFTCSIDNKYFGGCRPGTASSLLITTSSTYINSTIVSTSSVDNTPKVPLYGQCGGISYSGPTKCVDGAVCKYYGEWYSQCISA